MTSPDRSKLVLHYHPWSRAAGMRWLLEELEELTHVPPGVESAIRPVLREARAPRAPGVPCVSLPSRTPPDLPAHPDARAGAPPIEARLDDLGESVQPEIDALRPGASS